MIGQTISYDKIGNFGTVLACDGSGSRSRRRTFLVPLLCASLLAAVPLFSQHSDKKKEEFLLQANVIAVKPVSIGVTGTRRATLSDGRLTHDASVQTVDEYEPTFETGRGTELNFRDSYKYNIAAYRLDRLVNLRVVPVSVERRIEGEKGAFTWWVDDVEMMEKERRAQGIATPNEQEWNDQASQVRIFNELVYNTDANSGNFLITKQWKLVPIDFSRAFRTKKKLRVPQNLNNCVIDRRFYDGLREMNESVLLAAMKGVLRKAEVAGLLGRRDEILKYFDAQIAQAGEKAVVCDRPGH